MRITVDTNMLVRAVVADDPAQTRIAQTTLARAELVAIPVIVLCELCWVLSRSYGSSPEDIAETLRVLTGADNVAVDELAVEAGLAMLDAGGDFADGVIAHGGRWLGGETFVSFDRKAVALLHAQGMKVSLPQ